jgi:hypothetical protein
LVNKDFKRIAMQILNKYPSSDLSKRWQEAVSFGEKDIAQSYWIRDSEDVVNIVWLNSDGIRDIAWSRTSNETMFNYIPLKNILTFEIREMLNIAIKRPGVVGNYLVRVIQSGGSGDLWWVAENEESMQRLRDFLASVLTIYSDTLHQKL